MSMRDWKNAEEYEAYMNNVENELESIKKSFKRLSLKYKALQELYRQKSRKLSALSKYRQDIAEKCSPDIMKKMFPEFEKIVNKESSK